MFLNFIVGFVLWFMNPELLMENNYPFSGFYD